MNRRYEDEDQAILDDMRLRLDLVALDGHVSEDGDEDSGGPDARERTPQPFYAPKTQVVDNDSTDPAEAVTTALKSAQTYSEAKAAIGGQRLTKEWAVSLLCRITADVADGALGYSHATDCVCFASARVDGDGMFRHEGYTIDYIHQAVQEKMDREALPKQLMHVQTAADGRGTLRVTMDLVGRDEYEVIDVAYEGGTK